jgi:hypothetical protein
MLLRGCTPDGSSSVAHEQYTMALSRADMWIALEYSFLVDRETSAENIREDKGIRSHFRCGTQITRQKRIFDNDPFLQKSSAPEPICRFAPSSRWVYLRALQGDCP